MEQRTKESGNSYKFSISGKKGTYKVQFFITAEGYDATCSCKNSQTQKCWHPLYILSGRSSRIVGNDLSIQQQLIHELKRIPQGKAEILKAQKRFPNETHCRRCNSENITRIKYFYLGRIFSFFRDTRHTYFCKECKWTW